MSIVENLNKVKKSIPKNVSLVAVSKFHPVEAITEAYNAGQRIFGESKMQELTAKQPALPKDIEWHFIGHLQRNKVKSIIPIVHTIHSVDSERLFEEIIKEAEKQKKQMRCFLQIHIAQETTKYGLTLNECENILSKYVANNNNSAYIGGLMGMATNSDDENLIKQEFASMKKIFDTLKEKYLKNDSRFSELSMGMSSDYPLAIEEGSTMIRVGSTIFGNRSY